MDMIQVLTVIGVAIANIGTTITLFLWVTNHSTTPIMKTERNECPTGRHSIGNEDFHGRLCAIEERNKSK